MTRAQKVYRKELVAVVKLARKNVNNARKGLRVAENALKSFEAWCKKKG